MRSHHPTILHVNIRLGEGGAASIARDLHARLLSDGYVSRFAYGYGHRGKADPMETEVPNCFRVGATVQAGLNMVISRTIGSGSEVFAAGSIAQYRQFIDELVGADVVHLHCIHSYFTSPLWLLSVLADLGKPVVWTTHDHWLVTGRCALPGSCDGWRSGCGQCPTNKNYPPSLFDFSHQRFVSKRQALRRISNLHIVAPAQHMACELQIALPEARMSVIHNGLDRGFEKCLAEGLYDEPSASDTGIPQVLVVAANLSDPQKHDISLISELSSGGSCTVHTVGARSPFSGRSCVNHGVTSSRSDLVRRYSKMDVLLFTSRVDMYPMVIVEALSCGLPVVASSSAAADEVLGMVGGSTLPSSHDIKNVISDRSWWNLYPQKSKEELQHDSLLAFSGQSMCQAYESVYAQMLHR